MSNQEFNPWSDKKTWVGIALAMLFMVGWQHYLSTKYPNANKVVKAEASNAPQVEDKNAQVQAQNNTFEGNQNNPKKAPDQLPKIEEKLISFKKGPIQFELSNMGMGLKSFSSERFLDENKKPIVIGRSPEGLLFQTRWVNQKDPIIFDIREVGPGDYEGVAQDGNITIKRKLSFDDSSNSFHSKLDIVGWNENVKNGIAFLLPEEIRRNDQASWFFPSYDHQNFFAFHSGTKETINFNHTKEDVNQKFDSISIASVGNQYFSSALLDRSKVAPSLSLHSNAHEKTALAEIIYKPVQEEASLSFEQVLYAGPKSIDILKAIDPSLAEIIDFGMLSFIAKPFLYTMKWFYSLVGNWGIAIILLTLTVRIIVLPLHLMSARSMKGMQKIQPLLQQVREKYKDDSMAVHRETMALMKQHNANPISGCFPMLLQIPIFFALFRVVGSSVELYQSPFVLWIHDLSHYDQYFVLPILLGGLMWLQQKMTPTNMDPAQAKVMAFLPLIFTAFMLKLPSGLTLYMVVSSIFGIAQQWYVLRDNKKTA